MNTFSKFTPRTFSKYGIQDVPIRFRNVLWRIQSLLGSKVLIHSYDAEWLNFTVMNWSDRFAILAMNENADDILPGHDLRTFQILCPWDSSDMSGLLLHDLYNPATRAEYLCGC